MVAPRNRKYKDKGIYHAAHEDHSVCCSASRNGRVTVFVFLRKITVVTRFASQRLLCTLGWTFRIFGTVHHVGLSFSRLLGFHGVPNCCTVVSVCFPFATSLHGSFFGLPPVCKPSCKCLYHGSMKIREKSKDVNDMVNSYQICSICTENVCHHLPILNFKINNSKSRQGIWGTWTNNIQKLNCNAECRTNRVEFTHSKIRMMINAGWTPPT